MVWFSFAPLVFRRTIMHIVFVLPLKTAFFCICRNIMSFLPLHSTLSVYRKFIEFKYYD